MMIYTLIQWPWSRQIGLVPVEKSSFALPLPDSPRNPQELDAIRVSITNLTTVVAAQNERISGQEQQIAAQGQQIVAQDKHIKALQTVEAQLRGDLREAQTHITSLQFDLHDERSQRMAQAELFGDMKAQIKAADDRLMKQRIDITALGQQMAVVEDQRAQAVNVSTVHKLRAEAYHTQLVGAGITPIDEMIR